MQTCHKCSLSFQNTLSISGETNQWVGKGHYVKIWKKIAILIFYLQFASATKKKGISNAEDKVT